LILFGYRCILFIFFEFFFRFTIDKTGFPHPDEMCERVQVQDPKTKHRKRTPKHLAYGISVGSPRGALIKIWIRNWELNSLAFRMLWRARSQWMTTWMNQTIGAAFTNSFWL